MELHTFKTVSDDELSNIDGGYVPPIPLSHIVFYTGCAILVVSAGANVFNGYQEEKRRCE